jgi:glucokinase
MTHQQAPACVCLDAGGTFIKHALVLPDGSILRESVGESSSNSDGPLDLVVGSLAEAANAGIAFGEKRGIPVSGIAFAFPGPFEFRTGTSLMRHKYPNIRGVPLTPPLRKLLLRPELPVAYFHDVQSFIYSEYLFGAGIGFSRVFGITIGTGIGGGFLEKGRVVLNELGSAKHHIYCLPYGDGTLEDVVSRRGIIALYTKLSGSDEALDVKDIDIRARSGDGAALSAFKEMGRVLGLSLRPILEELGAEVLVVGGQISRGSGLFGPYLERSLDGTLSLKKVAYTREPDVSTLRGIMALFRDQSMSR